MGIQIDAALAQQLLQGKTQGIGDIGRQQHDLGRHGVFVPDQVLDLIRNPDQGFGMMLMQMDVEELIRVSRSQIQRTVAMKHVPTVRNGPRAWETGDADR